MDRAKYGGQGVGGSDAVRSDWDRLREVGTTARHLLIAAAAAEWNVPPAECETTSGVVHHRASGRRQRYGALAARAATMSPPAAPVTVKHPDAFRIIGTRVRGIDTRKIVTGQGLFGLDVKLAGMKYAAIAKCPVFGGRPVAIDASRARQVPGVRDVVEIKGLENPTFLMPGVAVVADSTWAAFKGREALNITWDEGAFAGDSNESLRAQFRDLLATPSATLHNSGDVEGALAQAAHRVDNTFDFGFVSHATLEPHNCTADVKDGVCTIRGPLQMPASGRTVVARALGIPPENVHVHSTRIGGGFGRRLMSDYAAEAAMVSRAIGAPVQVVDTRAGDLQHDYYRPAAMQRLRAGVDASGRIAAWDHVVTSVSRNAYRLDPRPPHSTEMYGSYIGRVKDVAEVVELSMDAQKRVVIHRVTLVADVGQPVNLSDLEAQAQGGTIDALGAAFFSEVTIARGRALEGNFDRYRLIRHREAPAAIDVHILPSRDRPTGFGEPPVPPVAPAVANAIAALTGERIRQMPFATLGWTL